MAEIDKIRHGRIKPLASKFTGFTKCNIGFVSSAMEK